MAQFPAHLVRTSIADIHPYSGGKPIDEVQREYGLDRVIKLASNECPMPPSPAVLAAIQNNIQTLQEYPDGNGYYLKQAIAQHLGVRPESITLGSGSSEILSLLVQCFCQRERGDSLLFPEYSFLVYSLLAQTYGLGMHRCTVDNWTTDCDTLLAAIDDTTRIIFLANPANPLGTHLDNQTVYQCFEQIPQDTLIVLDQAYADFVEDIDDTIAWLDRFPNLIITRTFSKAYGLAGLRVGYGLASTEITDFINRIRPPFNNTSPALVAALAALGDKKTLHNTVDNNRQQMRRLENWLQQRGIEWIPSCANFLTLRSPIPAQKLYQSLLEQGVIIRPLANYGMPDYLRITLGTSEQMDMLYRALAAVGLE